MSQSSQQEALCRALGYRFSADELLTQALTHTSAGSAHYERLEFLGDSVLSLIITEHLYARFPDLREGKLSRIRSSLVNGRSLARLAKTLGLGDCVQLGKGELKAGAHRRESILADSMEAVIGAIYLDGGIEVCRERLLALYAQRLADPDLGKPTKDSKTQLQEWCMARGMAVPGYTLESETGPPNDPRFEVQCVLEGGEHVTRGAGSSRKRAEQQAAQSMLQLLDEDPI